MPLTFSLGAGVRKVYSRNMLNLKHEKTLTEKNVCSNLRRVEYVSRVPLLLRSREIQKELQKGVQKPFEEVIKVDIGDAHAMGQRPITFLRQVLALTICPELLEDPLYPEDAKHRAREALDGCAGGSVGSYTATVGMEFLRKYVARSIEIRDGYPSDHENIIIFNGASEGIKCFLKLFADRLGDQPSGVMVPIPQYPLYSATITEFGLAQIGYYLNEENNWALNVSELERAYEEAAKTCKPRVLVVINPGNPTGQVLSRRNIEEIIKFAHEKRLFILADEVYQFNVYTKENSFHSVKKVMSAMGAPYTNMELASFMSLSKGFTGECGLRGGYAEFVNMDPKVMNVLHTTISTMAPNSLAQVALFVLVNPPRPGEPSYELFERERAEVLGALTEKSRIMVEMLNSIEGFKCNPSMGAIHVFPHVELPERAIKAAEAAGEKPDAFYVFKVLEATGICAIAGSCFGQRTGTYHFRSTILPPKDKITTMLNNLKEFHENFLKQYR